jgi:4-hydroxymandelate oxidase
MLRAKIVHKGVGLLLVKMNSWGHSTTDLSRVRKRSSLRGVNANRRQFLQFLAASSVLAPAARAWAQQAASSHEIFALTNAKDALDVMEFEAAARSALPPAHWGYMATGVDDDLTLKANVEAFKHIRLKPRRLVDVSKADLRTEVYGAMWETPIFVCPVGSQRAFHPEGELATARAARASARR